MANPIRVAWATALTLILALRLLTPAGFMPAFDHGAVTIVVCPDAEPLPPPMAMPGHRQHDHSKTPHQACPYAASASPGALGGDFATFAALIAALALPLGRPFPFLDEQRRHDRPPAIGPPIPA